jgi:tetrahydromethanopterin S-methyltransferase subunit E
MTSRDIDPLYLITKINKMKDKSDQKGWTVIIIGLVLVIAEIVWYLNLNNIL